MCSTHRRLRRTRGAGARSLTLTPCRLRSTGPTTGCRTVRLVRKPQRLASCAASATKSRRRRRTVRGTATATFNGALSTPLGACLALSEFRSVRGNMPTTAIRTGCRRAHADELFQQGRRKPRNHASALDHRVAITAPRFAYCWKSFSSVAAGEAAPILRLPLAASMTSTNSLYLSACLSSRLIMYMLQRPKVRNFAGSL